MAEAQEAGFGAALDPRGREIARRRGARDLWISRSHVAAAATASIALAVTAFGGGFLLGRDHVPAPAPRPTLTSELPRDELLQLLARIDGNAAGAGATDAITFPDALKGGVDGALPHPEAPPGAADGPAVDGAATPPAVHLEATPSAVVAGDAPGAGFTVVVGRFADGHQATALRERLAKAGIDAWIATELVDGVASYRVGVGHHSTEADAQAALPLLSGLEGAAVEPVGD